MKLNLDVVTVTMSPNLGCSLSPPPPPPEVPHQKSLKTALKNESSLWTMKLNLDAVTVTMSPNLGCSSCPK
jgi:hypothetical protein